MKAVGDWYQTKQIFLGAANGAKSQNAAAERGNRYHRRIYKLMQMQTQVGWQGWELLVEPWFRERVSRKCRSPDSVLVSDALVLVVEVKLNWKDGKDEKLRDEYLPIASAVFGRPAKPALITANVRGLTHEPLLGLGSIMKALEWKPGQPTPVILLP